MLLRHLLESLPTAHIDGPVDLEISDIVYDSRSATPGSLFVAMPSVRSARSDGSHFAHEAVARGAVAVLSERALCVEGSTGVRVTDARGALADVAARFYGYPAEQLRITAVTGTDGKTTTTYLLEQILAAAGFRTGLIGTVEIKVGERRQSNLDRMTTPESLDVQRLLRRMVDAGVTHVAAEASSHALALGRLRHATPSTVGLTNITADHIEFHGSPDAYFAAKASLFTDLGRNRPAVLNRDDASFPRLAPLVSGPLMTYGLHREADVRATEIRIEKTVSRFTMCVADQWIPASIGLPGRFNVLNALAAAALALQEGVALETIVEALSAAQPPPGRMQQVCPTAPFAIIVDYAHTMHAFETVLATLREQTPAPHRLIAVFGATGDRDRAKRPVLARVAAKYADYFIITNEDPYGEAPEAIMAEVAAGMPPDLRGRQFEEERDRGQAIARAIERARPGDTVVLLGKGHEQSMVVNGHKEPWSDVAAAGRALEGLR